MTHLRTGSLFGSGARNQAPKGPLPAPRRTMTVLGRASPFAFAGITVVLVVAGSVLRCAPHRTFDPVVHANERV